MLNQPADICFRNTRTRVSEFGELVVPVPLKRAKVDPDTSRSQQAVNERKVFEDVGSRVHEKTTDESVERISIF